MDVPPALADAIRNRNRMKVHVPQDVDDRVLSLARSRFRVRKGKSFLALPWHQLAGVAALLVALAAAFILVFPSFQSDRDSIEGAPGTAEAVDIFDAFQLARALQSGNSPSGRWDVNGDGRVDEGDVEALAARAVSLKNRGSGGPS